jgi:endonuclease/exonuclease/phosphatase family metal-dependent hydrolase
MEHAVGWTMPSGPWGYGNVILARGEFVEVHRFDLSVPNREPRGCLHAVIQIGDQKVDVIALHLGLAFGERRRQIDQLLAEAVPAAMPLVLGGDFNDWPPGPISRLLGRGFTDAAFPAFDFRATFPARVPLLRLDRLYSRGLGVLGYHIHRSPLAKITSDHLPVVADYVTLEPGAPSGV